MNLWLGIIILHAIFALIAFVLGILLLRKRFFSHTGIMDGFIAATSAMTITMVIATISHWSDISISEKIAFSLLPLLACYMIYRSLKAKQHQSCKDWPRFIDSIGFSLISYFDGFFIVALIDLHAPAWFIAFVAVAAIIVGNRYIHTIRSRLDAEQ